jgi:hypothetical protein
MHSSWEETAEKLTLEAVQAAEEGRWNTVTLCYQRRGELLLANDVPRSFARRLYVLDRFIHGRLRMATMSIQHLLAAVSSKRRLLERFDAEPQSNASQDCFRRISRRM